MAILTKGIPANFQGKDSLIPGYARLSRMSSLGAVLASVSALTPHASTVIGLSGSCRNAQAGGDRAWFVPRVHGRGIAGV